MEWRTIKQYPLYQVSEKGDIRRVVGGRGARIGPVRWRRRGAYAVVALYDGGGHPTNEVVHRLVARTFLGESPASRPYALHRDGDPMNNHRANIYWGTAAENAADRAIHGRTRTPPNKRGGNPMAKLTEAQVADIRARYAPHRVTAKTLAAEYGVRPDTIYAIVAGKLWAGPGAQRVQPQIGPPVSRETSTG